MKKPNNIASLFMPPAIRGLAIMAVLATMCTAGSVLLLKAAGDPIVVIVNNENPVDNLSMAELNKLFLSDRSRWDTGKAVAPVMLVGGAPERTSFLKIVCGMDDADLKKYFLAAAFSGKTVTPPKEVGSASTLKSFVAGSPGAIGFLKASDLPAGDSTVKAVKIEGAAASDPGYKLKM
jgi:ABC-type phosphate transport system substrate-binding protein